MMNITGTAHLGVRVANFERSVRFYEALGFKVIRNDQNEHVIVVKHSSGIEINILDSVDIDNNGRNVLMDQSVHYPGYTHLAMSVTDVKKAIQTIREIGITITEGPVTFGDGSISVFIRDPDSNVIEFSQPNQPAKTQLPRIISQWWDAVVRFNVFILLILSGTLAAGVFIIGKQAGSEQVPPLLLLFFQMSGGALITWAVSWPSRQFPFWDREHLLYYLIGGLLGISLPYVLVFIVLQQLQVGLVGLLTALSPVMTYAIARILGHEQGHPLRLLGLIIGLVGVTLLIAPQESTALSESWRFLLLALGIPLLLATSNIYRSRFWPAESGVMPLVIGMLTIQSVWLFAANLILGNFQIPLSVLQNNGLILTMLGVMAGGSYLASFKLLKAGGPVYLSQMGYVITAVTLLAGILWWGERYNSHDLLSMGLILSGVLLTTLTHRIHQPTNSEPAVTKR